LKRKIVSATSCLNDGARFNKLSVTAIREMKHALEKLEEDADLSVIVISGHPGDSFAVGADISQMQNFTQKEAFEFSRLGQSLFELVESSSKPVIAAINGVAMGGGCDLALACDIRLASRKAVIAHPGAKLGIITGFCGTQKLPRLVGKNIAREMFMTCSAIDAAEAFRTGMVNRVYEVSEFWPEVEAFAEKIAKHDCNALAAAKTALNIAEETDLKTGCIMETASAVRLR